MGPENNETSDLGAADDDRTTVDDVNLFDPDASDFHEEDISSSSSISSELQQLHFSPKSNGTSPFEGATSEAIVAASQNGGCYSSSSIPVKPAVPSSFSQKTSRMEFMHTNGDSNGGGSSIPQQTSNGWDAAVHNVAVASNSPSNSHSQLVQNNGGPVGQQQQSTTAISSNSTKVVFDYNKNLQCEVPLSSSEIAAAARIQTATAASAVSNGHNHHNNHSTNGIAPAESSTPTTTPARALNAQSGKRKTAKSGKELYEKPPRHIALLCYFSYVVLTFFGYLRDFMRKTGLERNLAAVEKNRDGYPQLYKNFEAFYTRNIYRRIRDCWNRPIASVPGAYIDLIDRYSPDYNWTFKYPGTTHKEINMGSYNYLGFAENSGSIHEQVLETLTASRVGVCSVRSELGTSAEVQRLERLMAAFLGTEASIVFGMGFATNCTNIATLVGPGSLILSDALNHASLILGCRLSGATIKTFKHNDMVDLERKVRKLIITGQPKSGRPWRKIIILVEGIYSMEGTIINLPELLRIKRRYKAAIYLDEAHSIGALGPNGRGVVDYYGEDAREVDVLMGTFTKSFAGAGGYIAGSRALVEHVRAHSFSSTYAVAMSPVIAKQIACVVEVLMGAEGTGEEGAGRIEQLARNTRYFRRRLLQMGFIVYGNDDSPVVPLLLCFCPKIAAVIRLAMDRGLGFIGAGFPATSLTTGRVRFCISAAHTKSILDQSLEVMNEIGDQIGVKYSRLPRDMSPVVYEEV